jgi:glycosyltransferase involved in cell wall biosynthesis
MDADLQHPPALIPSLVESWRAGYEIVNARRLDTAGARASKILLSRGFYWAFRRLTGTHLEAGCADFRLMARPAVDAFNRLPERHRFIRGLVHWVGFRQTTLPYHAPRRWAGQPKYTFGHSLRLAVEGMTAFSFYPLRSVAFLGFFVMAASSGFGLCALVAQLVGASGLPLGSWVLIGLNFYGGCQLVTLGILGEYLGRTLEQVKGRPLYIVRSAHGFAAGVHSGHEGVPRHHLVGVAPRAGALDVDSERNITSSEA